ncbi:MAG: hypothetical protein IT360_15680 [Gemmatimonadaceae bacterium]|nr:hypothetical protein [Gemmatimonadaceae bacterium]
MAFVQSNYGFTPGVDTLKGLKSFLSQDANYWLWRSGGGEMATFAGQDREEVRAYIQNVLKLDHVQTPMQLVKAFAEAFKKAPTATDKAATAGRGADAAILQPLRAFSSALEAATRLGEFRLALDKEGYHRTGDPGKQEEALMRAVIASRDVSIDFQRGGWWSRRHTQRSVFFNPALQGSLRLAETAKAHPIRTARRVAITSLAPALLSVVLRGLFDRDEEWAELDPGVRATYWHFPAPWGWLRVPKAYDIDDLVGTPMEATLAAIAQQDPAILKELVPGGYDGAVRWLLQRVVPSAFVPMIEYAANYKFFTDRPIVPESRRKVDLELQSSRYTSEFARRVAPKIGMAPDALDHLFYGYVGGMGRLSTTFVADPLIAAMDAATGRTGPPKPSRGIEGVPVLGVFVRHGGAGLQAKSLADLYDELEKWDGKMQSRREYRQAGNASKVSDVDAWITTHGGEKRYRALQKAREGMSAERATLNKVFRAPASVLTADDKAILLDAIEARMGNAARVAMGRQPLGVVTATPDPLVASLEKKLADWKPEAGIKKTPWTP